MAGDALGARASQLRLLFLGQGLSTIGDRIVFVALATVLVAGVWRLERLTEAGASP